MPTTRRGYRKKKAGENRLSAISGEASNLFADLNVTGQKGDCGDLYGAGKNTGVTLQLQLQKHRNPENLAEEKPWENLEILIH